MTRKWTDTWGMNDIKGVGLRAGVGLAEPSERATTTQARRQFNVTIKCPPSARGQPKSAPLACRVHVERCPEVRRLASQAILRSCQ